VNARPSPPGSRTYAALPLTTPAEVDVAALGARERALLAGLDSVEADALGEVVTALGENAVHHGGGGELRLEVSAAGWVVRAEDRGPGFPPGVLATAGRATTLAEELNEARGLMRVRSLAGGLDLFNLRCGAVAVARRAVPMGR
jgi:anti-sigma regulatory factor (Ser/Thr protein kinase)